MASSLDSLVKSIDTAATLPMVVSTVMSVCENPASDAHAVAEAVSRDPVISAKLLRTANSAYFGLVSKCSSVQAAVVRLGIKTIRNTVMGLGVARLFASQVESDGYSRPNVWRHSVAVGILNELLCGATGLPDARKLAAEAFLAGLVHDIGIILEDQYKSKPFAKIPPLAWELKSHLHSVERQSLGFDHQELGAAVLSKWRFPTSLCEAVALHHQPDAAAGSPLAMLTAMSEMLALTEKVGYCDMRYIGRKDFTRLSKRLGLTSAGLERVRGEFKGRYRQAAEIFALDTDSRPVRGVGYLLDKKDLRMARKPSGDVKPRKK